MHFITLKDTHTHTLCRTLLEEGSARRKDFSLATQKHSQETDMPTVGYEPAVIASDWP